MKKVLVTFAGGRAGLGICRAMKAGPEPPYIIGVESDKYAAQRTLGDEHYIVPRGDDPLFMPFLERLVEKTGAEFVWPVHESEISAVATAGRDLNARTYLPDALAVERGQDKAVSAELLRKSGLNVSGSSPIENEADLRAAFDEYGPEIWLRKTRGAGGKGSLPVSDYDRAMHWIALHGGFTDFIAARRLTGRKVRTESLWYHGDLVLMQGSEHLAMEFASLTMSGITGIGRASKFVSEPMADENSVRAVRALAEEPHGLFATDMLMDDEGTLFITEVNVGRFASGTFSHWTTDTVNAPYVAYRLAFDEMPDFDMPLLNPFTTGDVLIKGWGHAESSVPEVQIEREVAEYEALLDEVR